MMVFNKTPQLHTKGLITLRPRYGKDQTPIFSSLNMLTLCIQLLSRMIMRVQFQKLLSKPTRKLMKLIWKGRNCQSMFAN